VGAPPRPEVDKRSFDAAFLRYHERLTTFFDGTISALSAMAGLTLVTRSPIRVAVPDDWDLITLGAGWVYHGDINFSSGKAYMRKDASGNMETRGLVRRASGTSSLIVPFTNPGPYTPGTGKAQFRPTRANDLDASVVVDPLGIFYRTGSLASWFSLDGLRWIAADRTTLALSDPFPLQVAWTTFPSLVVIQSTLIGADKRPTSQRRLHLATWTTPPERSAAAFLVTRIDDLTPGSTYDLMVYAAA
jgi:hypothetical protein